MNHLKKINNLRMNLKKMNESEDEVDVDEVTIKGKQYYVTCDSNKFIYLKLEMMVILVKILIFW